MPEITFKARNGSRLSDEQAASYGARLIELMTKNKSRVLVPEDIVEDAKKVSAPYHNYFVWDNQKAGNEYRLSQARYLLRNIVQIEVISSEREPVEVRSFHCVTDLETKEKGYVPSGIVFSDSELSSQVVGKALNELVDWYKRYKIYSELSGLVMEVELLIKRYSLDTQKVMVHTK